MKWPGKCIFPNISKTQANYRSNAPEVGSEPMLTGCLQWPPPQLLPVTKWNPAMQPAQLRIFSPWSVSRRHGNMENAHSKLQKTQGWFELFYQAPRSRCHMPVWPRLPYLHLDSRLSNGNAVIHLSLPCLKARSCWSSDMLSWRLDVDCPLHSQVQPRPIREYTCRYLRSPIHKQA